MIDINEIVNTIMQMGEDDIEHIVSAVRNRREM